MTLSQVLTPVYVSRWAIISARAEDGGADVYFEDVDCAVHRPPAEDAVRDRKGGALSAFSPGNAVVVGRREWAVTRFASYRPGKALICASHTTTSIAHPPATFEMTAQGRGVVQRRRSGPVVGKPADDDYDAARLRDRLGRSDLDAVLQFVP
ncbi:hypothetical protein [Pseudonocardia charpentierae]|uniref:Uncharacterized protein n=1 Tax=Pseudonocardia charpentierae TaxID=3075545 RepID=A0ABU2NFT5_9PSEU|nr:hypothetical protein [Pseudonocardia sp. DSM 45834]MDT0352817.1 hypothetical protein [Pseudonocardia sp. DSM 45834]